MYSETVTGERVMFLYSVLPNELVKVDSYMYRNLGFDVVYWNVHNVMMGYLGRKRELRERDGEREGQKTEKKDREGGTL